MGQLLAVDCSISALTTGSSGASLLSSAQQLVVQPAALACTFPMLWAGNASVA